MKVDTGGFGLGGAPLGNLYAPMRDAEAGAVMGAALARGVRYFDTAPHYGNGLSEHRMGAALRDGRQERERGDDAAGLTNIAISHHLRMMR